MEKGLYRTKIPVKILGTEEGMYHIEFNNGACILCAETELTILKETKV